MHSHKKQSKLLVTLFALLCVSILAVGCSQSDTIGQTQLPKLPTPPTQAQVNDAKNKISQHFHLFLSQNATPRKSSGSNPMTYHQGPTMRAASVDYVIFWEPSQLSDGTATHVSTTYNSLVKRYFQDIGGSSLYQNNSQYYDKNGHIVNSSTFGGAWVDTSAYPFPQLGCLDPAALHGCLMDSQIQDEVTKAMHANGWTGGLNHLFYVYTSSGEGSCMASFDPTQCAYTAYCAYHSFYNKGNQTILYANMPYADSGCNVKSSPNNDIDADSVISVTSHEHMEAVTDGHIDAWYDASGNEIGDKCAWNFGSLSLDGGKANEQWNGHYYIVQQEWSNSKAGCVL